MTIIAQRFKVLDNETNVPVADFYSATSSDIFNSPNNVLNEVTADLAAFVDNAKGTNLDSITSAITNSTSIALSSAASDAISSIGTSTEAATRAAKGASGALKDLSSLSTKSIDKIISETLPGGGIAQSVFNKLSSACKNKALSSGGLGKPYDVSVSCNGNKRSSTSNTCNASGYSDLLNKLTGGAYKSTWSDANSALKAVLSLANYGYNLNMCGVLGAVSSGVDANVLSRASGSLLGTLSSKGNALGVIDVAAASAGLHPLLENPSAINQIVSGIKLPTDLTDAQLPDFSSKLTESLESLDTSWATSALDDIPSIANMAGASNALTDSLSASLMDNAVGEDALDTINAMDSDFLSSAVICGAANPGDTASLGNWA